MFSDGPATSALARALVRMLSTRLETIETTTEVEEALRRALAAADSSALDKIEFGCLRRTVKIGSTGTQWQPAAELAAEWCQISAQPKLLEKPAEYHTSDCQSLPHGEGSFFSG